jgi:hypothetical protein
MVNLVASLKDGNLRVIRLSNLGENLKPPSFSNMPSIIFLMGEGGLEILQSWVKNAQP